VANPPRIGDGAALDAALSSETFLLFKHSFRCPISGRAFEEYGRWHAGAPGTPTGWIDVVEDRDLSLRVEERTGVVHQSPQAILLRSGTPLWSESHGGIDGASLTAAVREHA